MTAFRLLVPCLAASTLLACGDDGTGPEGGLRIVTVVPAPNAVGVEVGTLLTVEFNQRIRPGTINDETFIVEGDAPLQVTLSYDPVNFIARASAPLLPDRTYTVQVTNGVLTNESSPLRNPQTWTFQTKPWEPVTIDDGAQMGTYTSLALDQTGGRHVIYFDDANDDLRYARCTAADCTDPASWQKVTIASTGSVGLYGSLDVDATGQLHVSYFDDTNGDLEYATCDFACTEAGNWETVEVDTDGRVGLYTSLAVDELGNVHIGYYDETNENLKYARCSAACGVAASWVRTTVAGATSDVGSYTSLAVDAEERVHIAFFDATNTTLGYAICAGTCGLAGSWGVTTLTAAGTGVGQYPSIAVERDGRIHVTFYDINDADLEYVTCTTNCVVPGNWTTTTIQSAGSVGAWSRIAVDGVGRAHVAYHDGGADGLRYATCAAEDCTEAEWENTIVATVGSTGTHSSIVVGTGGRIHFAFYDATAQQLRYVE